MRHGAIIVIDLGKTLSKVSLWSHDGVMIDRQTRPNAPVVVDGLRRLDIEGVRGWLLERLSAYAAHPVEVIVPVGHGAGVVALSADGAAYPPLDYEQAVPGDIMAAYRALRDPFAITGSPALPDGLNFGSQLYWMDQIHGTDTTLLPWAQYWAWELTGRPVSEVTSLGCHSDVWAPASSNFSPMARANGWAARFAPLVNAGDTVGTLVPEIAARTGLSADVRVLAGLHDSNAALLAARGFPEIADHEATVLSTGTWFIAMRSPAPPVDTADLPEGRDCLVNVDVAGRAVPSARFMGGREIETLIEIDTRRVDITPDQPALLAAVQGVLAAGSMVLPTLAPGFGPFPHGQSRWLNRPDDWHARRVAACLYAALVADAALDLIEAEERILIEGRFAEAQVFVRALAALRPTTRIYTANAHNDVSFGALRLIYPACEPQGQLVQIQPLDADLDSYRRRWLAEVTREPA